jgi:hypothetical protein
MIWWRKRGEKRHEERKEKGRRADQKQDERSGWGVGTDWGSCCPSLLLFLKCD